MSGSPKEGGNLSYQRRQTAADTTAAAKAISKAETAARDKKTARLRALRLAQEAATPAEPAKPAKAKAKPRKAAPKASPST